jgi:hypothetical protein
MKREMQIELIGGAPLPRGVTWKDHALAIVVKVAETHRTFTSDDVWKMGLTRPNGDARKLGAIMRQAMRKGICTKEPVPPVPTKQPKSHGSPMQVWRSLIFLALFGCVDSLSEGSPWDAASSADVAIEDVADGDTSRSADGSVDASDVLAPLVDAGADAPKCPTQGQGCANTGERICDDDTHYWYCAGTWTRNACVNGNPICMFGADGGIHCIGQRCEP